MRVMIVSAEYPPARGGVGDYSRLLGRSLTQAGAECHVLTGVSNSFGDAAEGFPIWRTVRSWGWSCRKEVELAISFLQPEVIHIQYQTAAYGMHPAVNFLPSFLRRLAAGVKVVTTFHDLRVPYLFPKAGPARHLAAMHMAGKSDAIVLVTPEHWFDTPLRWLGRLQWNLADKTYLIPIGSNIAVKTPPGYSRHEWRDQLGVAETDRLLCFFGFINPSKGVDLLLGAFKEIVRSGAPCKLLMLGGSGEGSNAGRSQDREEMRELALRLGVADDVIWTEYSDEAEVSASLLAADLCVFPFADGATLQRGTLLAALAHGLPVLSYAPPVPAGAFGRRQWGLPRNWEQYRHLLREGENIIYAPRGGTYPLAESISAALSDTARTRVIGQAGKQVAESLSWQAIAAEHCKLYEDITSGSG